jgi:Mg-chelatase subunit ChlD
MLNDLCRDGFAPDIAEVRAMTGLRFYPWGLDLLLALPGIYWLFRRGDKLRAEAVRKFSLRLTASEHSRHTRYVIMTAFGLAATAATQPVWPAAGKAATGTGLDIVFLLDVSRSMFTRDGVQSRIDQARAAIGEVTHHAADERIGLVVFAGNASVESPLSYDYEFLRSRLKTASRDSVTVGGTRLGDAIRFAARTSFDDGSKNVRELVLMSDGGDDQSAPETAAAELAKRGIRLVVSGVGDAIAPGIVPNSERDRTPVMYRGKPVIARPDFALLQHLCQASANCVYAALPDPGLSKTVLQNVSRTSDAAAGSSLIGSVLALVAAVLLAAESLTGPAGRKK